MDEFKKLDGTSRGAYAERGPRIEGFADRLVDVFATRAGSEDTGRVLDELEDSSEDLVRDLGELVVTLAFRCADLSTVYDITDPERRLVPAKVDRLRTQLVDASTRWLAMLRPNDVTGGLDHG